MRTPILILAVTFALTPALTACGYRTPLALPKPAAKPPATAPAPASAPAPAASEAK